MLPVATKDYRISSPFGSHQGIDLAVATGTAAVATVNGTIVTAKSLRNANGYYSYGNYVVIRDERGNNHYYAHLSAMHVRPGQKVRAGTVIGLTGNTGNSTGPHLHYEIRGANGKQVDPTPFLKSGELPDTITYPQGYDPEFTEQVSKPRTNTRIAQSIWGLPDLDPTGLMSKVQDILGVSESATKRKAFERAALDAEKLMQDMEEPSGE